MSVHDEPDNQCNLLSVLHSTESCRYGEQPCLIRFDRLQVFGAVKQSFLERNARHIPYFLIRSTFEKKCRC